MSSEQETIDRIRQAILDGEAEPAEQATLQALEAGVSALRILNDGLMAGADQVGAKFETGEYFLPELMLAGRAIKAAMKHLTPVLQSQGNGQGMGDTGIVVMATVQSDIHDIGKNMVASLLTASGFEVTDLGVDVPIKVIIYKAQELDADLIACSALLTTSIPFMRDLTHLLEAMGERQRFKVIIGGASVTPQICDQIGADGTAPNAMEAVKLARRLIREKRQVVERQG